LSNVVAALPSDSTDSSKELRGTIVKLLEDIDVDLSNLCVTVRFSSFSLLFVSLLCFVFLTCANAVIRQQKSRRIQQKPSALGSQR